MIHLRIEHRSVTVQSFHVCMESNIPLCNIKVLKVKYHFIVFASSSTFIPENSHSTIAKVGAGSNAQCIIYYVYIKVGSVCFCILKWRFYCSLNIVRYYTVCRCTDSDERCSWLFVRYSLLSIRWFMLHRRLTFQTKALRYRFLLNYVQWLFQQNKDNFIYSILLFYRNAKTCKATTLKSNHNRIFRVCTEWSKVMLLFFILFEI